jgi:hypothetical protein
VRRAAGDTAPLLAGQFLVVSESRLAEQVITAALAAGRYRYRMARTAAEAHRAIRECNDIHFAVFDCTAPHADQGLLATELRQLRPDVLIVGSSEGDDGTRFSALGIDYFLPRFWDVGDLHALLITRIAACPQCGLAWPLRRPLPGDVVRAFACRGCGVRRHAVMSLDAPSEICQHVAEVGQVAQD